MLSPESQKKSKLSVFLRSHQKKKELQQIQGVETHRHQGTKEPTKGPTHHQEEEAILPPPAPHAVPRPAPAATERVITVGSVPWQKSSFC